MKAFFSELRDRKVFRVAIVYLVAGWLVMQIADVMFPALGLPPWSITLVAALSIVGFPIALVLSWAYEAGPDGIYRDKRDSESPPASIDNKSVGVLPFADMSPGKDQEYFSDGLTEELLNVLAQLPGLRVSSRTSSFSLKNTNSDIRTVAERLGTAYVVEGSVRKAGDNLRITAQLIEAASDTHLWSQTYDRTLDDIFAVQDEIADEVAKAMRVTLLGHDAEVQRSHSQGAMGAYNEYLKGHHQALRGNVQGHEQALVHFEQALLQDPNLAVAWAGQSISQAYITGYADTDFSAGYEDARRSALRALELDPDLPEGYIALSDVQQSFDWDWAAAEASLRRALELRPGDAAILLDLASLKAIRGRRDEAYADIQDVVERDPLNLNARRWLAGAYAARGRVDEALQIYDQLELVDPSRTALYWVRGSLWLRQGEYELALQEFAKERFDFLELTGKAIAYHHLGQRDEAVAALQALISTMGESSSFQIAAVYAQWGDADNAMSWLERGYVIRDPGLAFLRITQLFDPIGEDPRFKAFLAKMNFEGEIT